MFRLWFLMLIAIMSCAYAKADAVRTLSLNEAILLAVRENPHVQQAQLSHVSSKFALEIQEWQFKPHYALSATRTTSQNYSVTQDGLVTDNRTGIDPSASWKSVYGTETTLTSSNNLQGHYNPGLTLGVMQPLMRGFGRPIVEAELYNARDNERISRLHVEEVIRGTVTEVINAYLDVISAENTLQSDRDSFKRAEESLQQTKAFIKAGHKAGVELITVQADMANAETRIENDTNILEQTRYALLTTIGLDPNTAVSFSHLDVPALIKKYNTPPLTIAKKLILENDIQYQVDQITIAGATKRSIEIAKDNTRWRLDVNASAAVGNGTGGGDNAGINSLVNGVNQTNMLTLKLTVPIDDKAAKISLINAKIGLREAELALKQERWNKETTAINSWHTIYSAERAMAFAERAETLQQQSYKISVQKYRYGLIDSLSLQTALQQLNGNERLLIDARISYLKALVHLDQLIGRTLQTWNVTVNYGENI